MGEQAAFPERAERRRGLEQVLDEHAELRDVVAQLRTAADANILSGLLQRLRDLLQVHFAREEAEPELRGLLGSRNLRDGSADAAERLAAEHRKLLASVAALVVRVEAQGLGPARSFAGEVAAFLDRLQIHDAHETEWLRSRGLADVVQAAAPSLRSQALEVNLRRTAVDVVIPPEQAVLLEITAALHGVHEGTRKLLLEINHRYAGWEPTLEDLHRRAMGDLSYYLADPRAPEAVAIFLSLYARVAEHAASDLRESAVRRWLAYLEKVVAESGDALPALLPVVKRALSRLAVEFQEAPRLAAAVSPRLRHLVENLLAAAPGEEAALRALELYAAALAHVYAGWLAESDPVDWWREGPCGASATPSHESLRAISHERLRECAARLERLTSAGEGLVAGAEELLRLPDNAEIERAYLDAAACVESEAAAPWENQIARIRWLIRLLSSEALTPVHARAISEIHHAVRDALGGAERAAVGPIVRETFAALRHSRLASSSAALALIAKLGEVVLSSGDPERARVVIDELLDWEFPGPGFSGFTDEWQVRVDPAHIRAIRAFLAVIQQNPDLARPLIAALVVHLHLGGVFVADTDLFQRDVSALLNSDIEPVYHQVKHLLRMFPVYFSDIGAEGELRDVSSRIDEIGTRKDPLCHFLRKQCHVESNPRLIEFVDAVGEFWATGKREALRPFVSEPLFEGLDASRDEYRALHQIFSRLAGTDGVRGLAALERAELERRAAVFHESDPVAAEKSLLLVRLRQLLAHKYEFRHDDLLERIALCRRFDDDLVDELREALAGDRHEQALAILIGMLEQLKLIILSGERSEGVESIYRKRHIAAGIPSMYGQYREEKFEAMGLSFRIESLASALFDRMMSEEDFDGVSRSALRGTTERLHLLLRAVRVDGCRARGLCAGIAMLEEVLATPDASVDQYVNVFQIISRSVEQLVRIRFIDVYQEALDRIVRRSPASGGADDPAARQERVLKVSDGLLRELIATSFGLQALDRLVGRTLRSLVRAREVFDRETLGLLASFDAERCCVPIDARETPLDGVVLLGNKGHLIKRMACDGLPVPPGFILTTELFRCWPAIQRSDLTARDLRARIRAQIDRLERETGLRFGDARRPLLLSVRSGSAISMPGVLDTFLDVGINEEIAEGLAARSGSAWGAWDAYRRFLQLWGMGHDIERDRFDELMRQVKAELGVEKKAQIPASEMKGVAHRYRRFVLEQGVAIVDDPAGQLERCIEMVIRSWDAEKARVYRAELQIAEEWGTAVVVQGMVYGNLNARSGTGVVLTCDPRRPSGGVRLHGDFIVQGQGDDVVSGLVQTHPISETQRRSEWVGESCSLEKDFPRIYRALFEHATVLIQDREMFHQELEFTFESDDPKDLYILQTRDSVMAAVSSVSTFVPSESLEHARLATGIGAAGGALSGRLAHTAEDVEALRLRHPGEPVILVRPDAVPDDIPLILRADGLLTSLGGATSHAALVTQQLGRTCVVGCRQLVVDERHRRSRIGGRTLESGDFISISGIDGSVYLGRHPCAQVRRSALS